jgi:hypothetical protein
MVSNKPEFYDEKQAAAYIRMSVAYLRCGRSRGVTGNRTPTPPHYKLGSRIRYARTDLDQWLAEKRIDPAARGNAASEQSAA